MRERILSKFSDVFFLRIYKFLWLIEFLKLALLFMIATFFAAYVLSDVMELASEYIPSLKKIYTPENEEYHRINTSMCFITTFILRLLIYINIDVPISLEGKERRDRSAQNILSNIRKGQSQEFIFYIRRFYSDTGIDIRLYNDSLISFSNFFPFPIDNYFWRAAPFKCPVIRIGGKNQTFSAGTIYFSEDEEKKWRTAFRDLAKASKIILSIPLTEEDSALLTEIEWIKNNNLLHKIVFVMPSKGEFYFFDEETGKPKEVIEIERFWNKSRKTSKDILNIDLPHYSSEGGYIVFPDGNNPRLVCASGGRRWREKDTIKDVLKGNIVPSRLKFSFLFAKTYMKGFLGLLLIWIVLLSLTKEKFHQIKLSTGINFIGENFFIFLISLALFHITHKAFGKTKGLIALTLLTIIYAIIWMSPAPSNQVALFILPIFLSFVASFCIGYFFYNDKPYKISQSHSSVSQDEVLSS